MVRPLFWLFGCFLLFAGYYQWRHWLIAPGPDGCIVGPPEPAWVAALGLSAHKTNFLGFTSSEKINQIYACLYGAHTHLTPNRGEFPTSFQPIIPDWVVAMGIFQLILSAALVFLCLLAIRNHFRIK